MQIEIVQNDRVNGLTEISFFKVGELAIEGIVLLSVPRLYFQMQRENGRIVLCRNCADVICVGM